jgi:ATP-dependent RNA helicase DeaD
MQFFETILSMVTFTQNYAMSKTFAELGINLSFRESLTKLKILVPTDIQSKTIPAILTQKEDLVALAKTGTGKTLAFGLPLLQSINTENSEVQALILAPTRELSQQIYSNLTEYGSQNPATKVTVLSGGIPIKPQIERLKTASHIVVATPGRILDLISRGAISLKNVSSLVLDEADEMISNFKDDLERIIKEIPASHRTLLFTATLSGQVKQLIQNFMSKHVIQLEADMLTVGNQGIEHQYIVVEPIEKLEVLLHFLSSKQGQRGVIFCKTKAAVNKLGKNLAINKFSSGAIHGSLTQGIRDRIMDQFREGYIDILVATDLAARGIDVKEISYVVNYHLPDTYEAYVHRSGRTSRAGFKGLSLTVLQEEEVKELLNFENELGINFNALVKADPVEIEKNNGLLWAKKIFKTKPNRSISEKFRKEIVTVFHHLTKEELIDKVLANYLINKNTNTSKESSSKNRNKN